MLMARNTHAYLECNRSALEDPSPRAAGRHVVQVVRALTLQRRRALPEGDERAVRVRAIGNVIRCEGCVSPDVVASLSHAYVSTLQQRTAETE